MYNTAKVAVGMKAAATAAKEEGPLDFIGNVVRLMLSNRVV